jgi:hypothetical protein
MGPLLSHWLCPKLPGREVGSHATQRGQAESEQALLGFPAQAVY